ncbi:MAG: sigma-54-dependent Fis family transcriptional regulator [Deltaproteobacteria bacterium]|nr:sigma-54-dependent Fis family transcriptional regulator [Deltaproteobacteria bacterium]
MSPINVLLLSYGASPDKKLVAGLKKGDSPKGDSPHRVSPKGDLPDGDFNLTEASPDLLPSLLGRFRPDVLLLYFSQKEGREKGIDLLRRLKSQQTELPVICLSPLAELEGAVSTMKMGAWDYFGTPPDLPRLKKSIREAAERHRLVQKFSVLESQVGWQGKFDDIVGVSPIMQEIFHMVQTVAKSHATVLILGESGTGKELIAKAIHGHSERTTNRFIDINCGAIPKELLENELFGHERGSFTGADRQYIGSCERANGGTLFLDEISEMDPSLQVKLLRVLQERSFTRIGGTSRVTVDIRVIAATNKNIRAEVEKGHFREDLYYRLNVVPIQIPPLRSRREDIPFLARHFLQQYCQKNNKRFKEFTAESLEALVNYDWPGNVRELENAVERLVVLHDDTRVKLFHLPRFVQQSEKREVEKSDSSSSFVFDPFQKVLPLELVERYAIEAAVTQCGGDIAAAAKKLDIGQATLYRKLKRYGVPV